MEGDNFCILGNAIFVIKWKIKRKKNRVLVKGRANFNLSPRGSVIDKYMIRQ
jgi:hypothetical protein